MSAADEETPRDRVTTALEDALDRLEAADDADRVPEAVDIEDEAVQILVEAVAQELADGWNASIDPFTKALSDASTYFPKSAIMGEVTDRVEELRADEDGGPPPLNEFIDARLECVEVTKTTDLNQGAWYSWDFGTFRVQTRSGKDGRGHFRWDHFRDLILESGSVNVSRPPRDLRSGDDWRRFMVRIVEERGETLEVVGSRTRAVQRLKNRIANSPGYGTPSGCLDYSGVWVVVENVDLPEW